MRPFTPGIYLKYSKLEHVEAADDVHHPIIREAIKLLGFRTPQVEITTLADIPAGTGLGSSGSFTTALLKALYAHRRRLLHPSELAELACEIEIERLKEPIGKQDQYIAGVRRADLLHLPQGREGRSRAAQAARSTRSSTSRTTCCCSSPGSRAAPAASSPISINAHARHDAEMLQQPALRQGARRCAAARRSNPATRRRSAS